MTSQANKKEFDCIAKKRDAQAEIYEEIKDLSPEQQIEYFRKAVQSSQFHEWWERASSSHQSRVNRAS